MSGQITWSDFWSWIQGSKQYNLEMAKQLDLENWLVRLAPKIQTEVMKDAPQPVIKALKKYISPDVYKKLTGEKVTSSREVGKVIDWTLDPVMIKELRRRQDEQTIK